MEIEDYELRFDDQTIKNAEMQRIVCLSPNVDPPVHNCDFMLTFGSTAPGEVEKSIIALPLGTCMPGYTECNNDEQILDEAFLRNASKVLDKTREQIRLLKEEPLPMVLEPVRAYLLLTLETSFRWKLAEYAYLRNSNMKPAQDEFCQQCRCPTDAALLDQMGAEKDPQKRLKLATYDFEKAMVHCFALHDPGYPMQVWKDFLKEYRVTEILTPKTVL